ncbi:hypothetical protein SAMN05192551_11151 [Tindallia magadiensis]|uniref:Thioredoxin-like [2Fe-2S] ferredoxin n=1 Tax=Tindallia magadiensis TaxID=69895 RepID=A0A1I3H4W5_9FIRM|nr:(2Fe-2S) ferredoxin domain-containing protein [Tindallia magadiensis]SFI30597.1 hypothetical protein SAMN05192551_11151 [Tindallia magadiensis]
MTIIHVCVGSACHLKGSYNVISAMQEMITQHGVGDQVEAKALFCMDQCGESVSVRIGNEEAVYSLTENEVEGFFAEQIVPRFKK